MTLSLRLVTAIRFSLSVIPKPCPKPSDSEDPAFLPLSSYVHLATFSRVRFLRLRQVFRYLNPSYLVYFIIVEPAFLITIIDIFVIITKAFKVAQRFVAARPEFGGVEISRPPASRSLAYARKSVSVFRVLGSVSTINASYLT